MKLLNSWILLELTNLQQNFSSLRSVSSLPHKHCKKVYSSINDSHEVSPRH